MELLLSLDRDRFLLLRCCCSSVRLMELLLLLDRDRFLLCCFCSPVCLMELFLLLDPDRSIVVLLLQFSSFDGIVAVVGTGSVYCCVVATFPFAR